MRDGQNDCQARRVQCYLLPPGGHCLVWGGGMSVVVKAGAPELRRLGVIPDLVILPFAFLHVDVIPVTGHVLVLDVGLKFAVG